MKSILFQSITDVAEDKSMATPSQSTAEPSPLSQISIPSNLQEILASINQPRPGSESSKEEKVFSKDDVGISPPPPPIISKAKHDITQVFEKVPEMSKTKSIKFDLKLKSRDIPETSSFDVDDRLNFINAPAPEDKDERTIRIGLADKDERIMAGTRDLDERPLRRHSSHRRSLSEKEALEEEWEGSIRKFEEQERRKNEVIRRKEIDRLKRRIESDSD